MGARSWIVRTVRPSAASVISRPEVFARELTIAFEGGVHVRLGMKQQPVMEVSALLGILEQHQRGNAQHGHHVLQDHVHTQAEHLSVQKPSENVRTDRQSKNREQLFSFEAKKRDACPEVSIYRYHFE